jgi:hypothetical protein
MPVQFMKDRFMGLAPLHKTNAGFGSIRGTTLKQIRDRVGARRCMQMPFLKHRRPLCTSSASGGEREGDEPGNSCAFPRRGISARFPGALFTHTFLRGA